MGIKETDYYIELKGGSDTEPFLIRIQKDCSQISIEKEDGDGAYIDVYKSELKLIRDVINKVLND